MLEGELELTVDGVTQVARPGVAAIVPSNARHSVRALTNGRVIIVDSPARAEFGGSTCNAEVQSDPPGPGYPEQRRRRDYSKHIT